MAVKLTGNYAKRLGLPGYSSHQFSVSLETELTDLSQAQDEVTRLYRLLQDAVDREIQTTGFVPGPEYANGTANAGAPGGRTSAPPAPANAPRFHPTGATPIGYGNGSGNGSGNSNSHTPPLPWACSDKQRELILRLMDEHRLEEAFVEDLATERFGVPLRQLNKLQASGLIDELLERCNSQRPADSRSGSASRKGGRR